MKNKLLYDTHETPPFTKLIILALQHVFAMFGATIMMPALVNQAAGCEVISLSTALLASGIGTLIYLICTKGKSPVYLGSSFAFITPIVAAFGKDGLSGFATGIISVGLIYILFSLLIRLFGKNWINKLLPPIVVGPMIMIIGLSLAPNAVSQIGLAGDGFVLSHLLVALVSFIVTALVAVYAKGFFKVIPFLVGILAGYTLSLCLGIVELDVVTSADFFSLPKLLVPIKDYTFSVSGFLTMAPIALVSIAVVL